MTYYISFYSSSYCLWVAGSNLVIYFLVIDDGSLTDDMLFEIINNVTRSNLGKENLPDHDDKPSTSTGVKGLY